MTSAEMEEKCIALMKELGVYEDEEKLLAWLNEYVVTTDTETDDLVVHKRSEFKPDLHDLSCVLCACYDPFVQHRPGSKVQPCHDCQYPIVVSDDSPVDPPKVCRDCAIARQNKNKQEGHIE